MPGMEDLHTGNEWPEPEPLNAPDDPLPYPLEALPDEIREAVEEVLCFAQSPPPLAACSALAALSLVGQGLADVRRTEGLTGPISLFFLTMADSGERKSSVDGHFMAGIREWELRRAEDAKPAMAEYRAAFSSWEAERAGHLAKIKSKPSQVLRDQLREHEKNRPEAPRYPRVTHENTTPESLAWDLATKWPSGGVMSSEAGIVFGGHANGKDSIVRNLAQLNKLWDGGSLSISRRTSESFTVRGARLTMGLATQSATIREFFEASKGLARGSGFFARFLVAHPESTQGTRFWKDAPASWPNLTRFRNRLIELFEMTPFPDRDRGLEPPMMDFSVKGFEAWKAVYNLIEADLAPERELSDLKDVASKAGDNVSRIAALFALYEEAGVIEADNVERASRIVVWHLHEAKRFFGDIYSNPQDLLAAKLDRWLLDQGKFRIPKNDIRQFGPNQLRRKEALDSTLAELEKLHRVQIVVEGKKQIVEINPALLKGEKP